MENFKKVMFHFMMMWVLTAVGLFVGTLLPSYVILPISIITFILLIVVIFIRSIQMMNSIMYAIPFLLGITLFWTTQFYIDKLGADLVLGVFIGMIVIFILLGLIGVSIRDISGIGSYLFGALLVCVMFSLIFMFVSVSNMMMLVLAAFTVLVFVIYTIYDFNQIKHNHVSDDETVIMALNLYLDFVNLFVKALQIIYRLTKE